MKQIVIIISLLSFFLTLFGQKDSLNFNHRKNKIENNTWTKEDSIQLNSIRLKANAVRYRADSITFRADSLRILSDKLNRYNNSNYNAYRSFDSIVYNNYDKDTLVKEITMEVNCNPDASVFIENLYRKLIIKTSTDNKVKITTSINYNADSKLTDAEWFQKLNLELKSSNNQVVLKSDNLSNGGNSIRAVTITGKASASNGTTLQHYDFDNVSRNFNANSIAVFDGDGNWVNKRSNTQKVLTIYIPVGVKLDIESKYADVEIQNDLKNLKADISNASLRFSNIENVDVQGKYANINTGNIKKADIEINNSKFYGKDIYSAKFNSKYSSVEFGITNDLKIESNNDQYEIDEVGDLTGKKNYGNIRITNLKRSLDLIGNSADIKIRDINAGISNIKIDDKYADIRIPMNNLANYAVDFDGNNSNVYAPFEKIPVIKIEEKKKEPETIAIQPIESKNTAKALSTSTAATGFKSLSSIQTFSGYRLDAKDNAFKATVGDTKGKHAVVSVKCINCTVDFK